jgi:hypothetical protein
MDWKQLLAYSTGTVDQELPLRNEYLVTENRMLRNQIKGRIRLSDGERKALAAALSTWSSLCQKLGGRDVLAVLIRGALRGLLLGTARVLLIS